jgi:deoxyribodipyrimidine photo-lyase
LLHAQEEAKKRNVPLAVVFSLVPTFLQASIRMYGFMLDGLKDVQQSCLEHNIPFHLLTGYPQDTVPKFVEKYKISLIVTDMSPLRTGIEWRNQVCDEISHTDCGFHIVDAHNICPVWTISNKVEYGARTLRVKINKVLDEYLTGFPLIQPQSSELTVSVYGKNWKNLLTTGIDWEQVKSSLEVDRSVREVTWCVGGENAARQNLNQFLSRRLNDYERRNDPTVNGLSNMSPWLHFGNIASQRCVLEAKKFSRSNNEAVKSFVEEIVVRKELSDNFCYYNPNGYDHLDGLYPSYDNNSWAQRTLQDHESDRRDYTYTRQQFEAGKTHEKLWNAAQLEMVYFGKMHGFMRMYWAKKILEWSKSPTEALETAIYLNDKYSLDGRDPNGYAGCAWAIAGLHDQGWRERPVFGKIRYMNHAGCKRKFNVEKYVGNVQKLVRRFAKLK